MNQIILNRDKTGDKLKGLIHSSDYTYNDIADILNLSTTRVIYDWINGFKLPKIEHLVILANLLHVKIEDILEIENVF
jgi:transcriptional regulator with XRE-family HTH domain